MKDTMLVRAAILKGSSTISLYIGVRFCGSNDRRGADDNLYGTNSRHDMQSCSIFSILGSKEFASDSIHSYLFSHELSTKGPIT
jgi:hypothetical protein